MILALWLSEGHALDLSYEDALKRAVERNPELARAGLDLEGAEGALLASRASFDPFFTANSSYGANTSEGAREFGQVASEYRAFNWGASLSEAASTGTTLSLATDGSRSKYRYHLVDGNFDISADSQFQTSLVGTVTQSLLQGVTSAYNLDPMRQAKAARDVASAALRAQHQQTLADTANAYWAAYYLGRTAEIARSALDVAKEEQRVVHAKVEAGELAPVERARVDTAVVQAETMVLDAETQALASVDGLLVVIGESPGQEVKLTSPPVDAPELQLDEEALVATALEQNPDVLAARVREETAQGTMRASKQGLLPQLDATASYGLQGFETSLSAATAEMMSAKLPEWSVGGTLELPLLNRYDRGLVSQRSAAAEKATIDREALERLTDQLVRAQVRTLEAAHQRVALADSNVALAAETLDAERALQATGRAIQKDVLETLRAVDDARVQAEKARADYQVALVELERLKGTL